MFAKAINTLTEKAHFKAIEAHEHEEKAKLLRAQQDAFQEAAEIVNNLNRIKSTITIPNKVNVVLKAFGPTGCGKGTVLTRITDILRLDGCIVDTTDENEIHVIKE